MFNYNIINIYFEWSLILYIPIVFTLQYFISFLSENTKKNLCNALELPWASWCFMLSIFSLFGMYYTGKYLFTNYDVPFDLTDSSFWYDAFIVSKIFELLDTVFIVLRSKPLVALQWYHHWVTMGLCYYVSHYRCDQFHILFFMNYFVHTFMYAYFGLYCFFGKKIKFFGTFVNIIQTLQMFLAMIIGLYIYHNDLNFSKCVISIEPELHSIYYFGMFMYFTYFVMFVHLFFQRQVRLNEKNK